MASAPTRRRYVNPWKPLQRSDITSYSYQSKTVTPEYTDLAGRPAERLHTSLACLGALLSCNRIDTAGNNFLMEVRLFNDTSTVEDFNWLLQQFLAGFNNKLVKVVDGSTMPNTVDARSNSLDDWKSYKRIIVHYHIPPEKWAIFVVSPSKKKDQTSILVDGYLVGDIEVTELNAFIVQMTYSFHLCFLNVCPTYRRRLIVPKSFETSNAFLSFLIMYYLTRSGSYLDLTPDHIMKYKIMFSRSYREFHDSWLGGLSLTPTHPFIAQGFEEDDGLSGLVELGWTVVDVLGDGNCGYYSMILGLENMGIYTFSASQAVAPRPVRGKSKKSKVPSMSEYKDWQECIVRFRVYLQQHSRYLLRECYPPEQRNLGDDMWMFAGASRMEDIDGDEDGTVGLSQQIYNEKLETKEYFTEDFEDMVEYHMNPFWVPHVLASLKKIRVIVYTRATGKETGWSVTTFDGTGARVTVSQQGNIEDHYQLDEFRLSDLQFKEKPTIELLFLNGYEEDSTNHFLFLRRFLCDGLPPPPPAVQPSLLDRMIALPINDDPWEFSGDMPDETWKQLRNSNRKPPPTQANNPLAKSPRSQTMDTLASMRSPINEKADTMSKSNEQSVEKAINSKQSEVFLGTVDTGSTTTKTAKLVTGSVTNRTGETMGTTCSGVRKTIVTANTTQLVSESGSTQTSTGIETISSVVRKSSKTTTSINGETQNKKTDPISAGNPVSATDISHAQSVADSIVTKQSEVPTESIPTWAKAANTSQLVGESNTDKPGSSGTEVMVTTTPTGVDTTATTGQSIGTLATEGIMTKNHTANQEHNESRQVPNVSNNVAAASHEQISSEDSDDDGEEKTRDKKRVFAELKKQTSHVAYKRKNRKAKSRQRAMETRILNQMYRRKEISNSRLFYDLEEDKFYSCKPFPDKAGYTKRVLEENPEEFGEFVYETALKRPGQWIGPRLGDAGEDDAPEQLCTSVRLLYQQHRKPYCLILSLASALHYCGIEPQARWIAETAAPMSEMETDDQLKALLPMMRNFVPVIGNAYMYGVRTKGHKREKRSLSWNQLFTTLTKYPTVIIPMLPNGDTTHAFCVVDDLIFDSSTPFALKLNMESVDWIFGNERVELHKAYRFCNRWSPKNQKSEGEYKHELTLHWDRSEMELAAIGEIASDNE